MFDFFFYPLFSLLVFGFCVYVFGLPYMQFFFPTFSALFACVLDMTLETVTFVFVCMLLGCFVIRLFL